VSAGGRRYELADAFGVSYRQTLVERHAPREAFVLGTVLVELAYVKRSRRVDASERQLQRESGLLDRRSLQRARGWLTGAKLLEYDPDGGGPGRGGHRGAYVLVLPKVRAYKRAVRPPLPKKKARAEVRAEERAEVRAPARARVQSRSLSSSSSTRASANGEPPELARVLAPLERLDGGRLDGRGRDQVAAAFAEDPGGVSALASKYLAAKRDGNGKRATALLVTAVRRGEHAGAGERIAVAAVCVECGVGGGRHEAGCHHERDPDDPPAS
jgi:hypothetical protein